MRSITFISAAMLSMSVAAGPLFAAPPEGCFARSYSDAHLAKNPQQVVRHISIAFGDFNGDVVPWMDVQVEMADQGHAKGTGQGGNTYGQIARCFQDDQARAGWTCSVECDGGIMQIDRLDATQLRVRLQHFIMATGEGCGGHVSIAEVPGQSVTYRLDRQPDAQCSGRW